MQSELGKDMVELIGRLLEGLEVPLRAFCWKGRGGGGRLRHATVAKAVAVASACLFRVVVVVQYASRASTYHIEYV